MSSWFLQEAHLYEIRRGVLVRHDMPIGVRGGGRIWAALLGYAGLFRNNEALHMSQINIVRLQCGIVIARRLTVSCNHSYFGFIASKEMIWPMFKKRELILRLD